MQTIQHAVKKKPEKISVGLFFGVEESYLVGILIHDSYNIAKQFLYFMDYRSLDKINLVF